MLYYRSVDILEIHGVAALPLPAVGGLLLEVNGVHFIALLAGRFVNAVDIAVILLLFFLAIAVLLVCLENDLDDVRIQLVDNFLAEVVAV